MVGGCRNSGPILGIPVSFGSTLAKHSPESPDDAAVAQREAEIQRLERLVWDAVYLLQKKGLDSEAARLRRAIEKR